MGDAEAERSGESSALVEEVAGDLFSVDPSVSLAQCIGADARMGKGIAVEFRRRFGADEVRQRIRQEGLGPGTCVAQTAGERSVFHLVTKARSTGKPTYATMEAALGELRRQCDALGIARLAMPRIGAGLDRLRWPDVRRLLFDAFRGSPTSVTVFYLQDNP